MVPNGWKSYQLSELCAKPISYGIVQTGENIEDGIPCLRVVDLSTEKMNPNQMIKTSLEINQAYKKTILEDNEIVMALRGEVGLVRLIDANLVGANITRGLARISAKKGIIHPEYLLWELRSPRFRADLIRRVGGSALQEISLSELRKVNTLVPSLNEQQKIAQILSTWDQAISATEKLLENSQQQKKALMQQLLTGKKRLLDENGVRFSESWCLVKLRDVLKIDRGFAFKSNQYKQQGIRIIRVTNLESNGYIETVDCVYLDRGEALEYKKYALREHDVLLVMVGATAGKLGFVTKQTLPALLNQNMWLLRSKDTNQFTQSFLKHLSQVFIEKYLSAQQGSARGFFTQSTFEKVTVKIPKVEEQLKIVSALSLADQEIETLQKKLDCLKQEKKALMQQLLTGKKRVKVAA